MGVVAHGPIVVERRCCSVDQRESLESLLPVTPPGSAPPGGQPRRPWPALVPREGLSCRRRPRHAEAGSEAPPRARDRGLAERMHASGPLTTSAGAECPFETAAASPSLPLLQLRAQLAPLLLRLPQPVSSSSSSSVSWSLPALLLLLLLLPVLVVRGSWSDCKGDVPWSSAHLFKFKSGAANKAIVRRFGQSAALLAKPRAGLRRSRGRSFRPSSERSVQQLHLCTVRGRRLRTLGRAILCGRAVVLPTA
mmetsp:Transcript_110995/g.314080  ORF Transcript_110995/g.314080 Transcript_110995/m.314080 type:complete len:251 (-) Transcript_110995:884-1636(-)